MHSLFYNVNNGYNTHLKRVTLHTWLLSLISPVKRKYAKNSSPLIKIGLHSWTKNVHSKGHLWNSYIAFVYKISQKKNTQTPYFSELTKNNEKEDIYSL